MHLLGEGLLGPLDKTHLRVFVPGGVFSTPISAEQSLIKAGLDPWSVTSSLTHGCLESVCSLTVDS